MYDKLTDINSDSDEYLFLMSISRNKDLEIAPHDGSFQFVCVDTMGNFLFSNKYSDIVSLKKSEIRTILYHNDLINKFNKFCNLNNIIDNL